MAYSVEFYKIKDKAVAGKYDIPEFQRAFVWGPEKVKDLVDSLWRRYPIGTVLLWDSSGYTSPRSAKGEEPEAKWIVDGQQRTTACCLVFGKKPFWWYDTTTWNRFFEKCDVLVRIDDSLPIEFALPNPIRCNEPNWLSVRKIINASDEDLSKLAMETVIRTGKSGDMAAFSEVHGKLSSVQKIKEAMVTIMEVDHEIEDVTEIFSRLNTKGTKVKDTDVAVALIASLQVGWVREYFLPFLQDLETRGYDFDPSVIMRTLSAMAKWTTRLKDIKKDFWKSNEFGVAWKETKDSISFIIKKMSEKGILSADLLPSHNALVPLFVLYKRFEKSGFSFDQAFYWFLRASWAGRYSGSATTTLNQDLETVKNARGFADALTNLLGGLSQTVPQQFDQDYLLLDYRNEFVRLMLYLVIFDCGAIDWIRKTTIGFDTANNALNEGFFPEWHHFFPKSVLGKRPKPVDEEQINVAANITVLTEKQKVFRTSPEQYITKFSIPEEYLKQQFIPLDHELWKTDNYELFISERARLLCNAINDYFQKLASRDRSAS
jgi:hypothetical protein